VSNLTTVEQLAVEHDVPVGRALYISHLPNAPRPALRRGREVLYDRDELLRHLLAHHWVARC
jgi:hypothetical protein